jgi:hypothetical protein
MLFFGRIKHENAEFSQGRASGQPVNRSKNAEIGREDLESQGFNGGIKSDWRKSQSLKKNFRSVLKKR